MEELRIEVLVVMEHAPDGVEEAAHDGHDGDLLLFAAGEEGFVGGADLGAALDGDQSGHEQRQPEVEVAGAADVARGVGGAALARTRVEAGVGDPLFGFQVPGQDEEFAEELEGAEFADAGNAAQAGDLDGEVGLVGGLFGGGLLESFEALLQMPNLRPQIGGDEAIAIGGKLDGVQAGLFASEFLAELEQPPTDLLQAEHRRGRRSPRDEVLRSRNSRMPKASTRSVLARVSRARWKSLMALGFTTMTSTRVVRCSARARLRL